MRRPAILTIVNTYDQKVCEKPPDLVSRRMGCTTPKMTRPLFRKRLLPLKKEFEMKGRLKINREDAKKGKERKIEKKKHMKIRIKHKKPKT